MAHNLQIIAINYDVNE